MKSLQHWLIAFSTSFVLCLAAWASTRVVDKVAALFDPFLGHDENLLTPWTLVTAPGIAALVAMVIATLWLMVPRNHPVRSLPLQSRMTWSAFGISVFLILAVGFKFSILLSGAEQRAALALLEGALILLAFWLIKAAEQRFNRG